MTLLDEHAGKIARVLDSIARYGPDERKRLCWAVTQGEYDALKEQVRPAAFVNLRDLHILGMRVVVVPDLGELVIRG